MTLPLIHVVARDGEHGGHPDDVEIAAITAVLVLLARARAAAQPVPVPEPVPVPVPEPLGLDQQSAWRPRPGALPARWRPRMPPAPLGPTMGG